jgi:hypothetical protein
MSQSPPSFPCPACGYLSFSEPPGSYQICSVCKWQDDLVQLDDPLLAGGANELSLFEAQKEALVRHPLEEKTFGTLTRDPSWRPLTQKEATELSEREAQNPASAGSKTYYWIVPGKRQP